LVNVEKCYRFNSLSGNETVTLMNSLKSVPYQNDVWRATYPELYTILEDEPNYPKNCYAGNHLLVNCGPKFIGGAGIHPEAYSRGVFNQDLELPSVDFIDPANGDYRLPEDSVVFERLPDFEQLQIEQMGRYTKRAEEAVQASVVLAVDSPKTYNGGLKTDIESGNTRVVPSLVDGEIFVPLRFLAEIWGMDVTFYPETGQVVLLYQGNKLALVPGNCRIQKNSTEVLLASAPFISEEGRTMVPLQMMEDVLDKTVYQNDNGLIALNDGEPILHGAADSYLADFLYNNLTTY